MNWEDIYLQNPWWESSDLINSDKNIRTFSDSTFKYYPSFLNKMDYGKKGVYTLRGPRQVGKTTSLKLMIKTLIERDMNPSNLLYLTLDNINDRDELIEVIKRWVQLRKRNSADDLFLFLDEISFIKDWQISIKYLFDIGLLTDCFVFLSGSSAYDIKRSSERLPGRRGEGVDIIQLPVSFKGFVQTTYKNTITGMSLSEIIQASESDLSLLELEYGKYLKDFNVYKESGGFPKVINTFYEKNMITDSVVRIYEDFLLGDIERFSKSRTTLIELMKKTPQIVGQRFSWNSLNNDVNFISSVNTVESYFQILGMNFIASTVLFFDPSKREIRPRKQKKVYPLDPIISRVIERISGIGISEGNAIESLVLENILKFSANTSEGLNLYYGPYYWYSAKGNEIDFLVEWESELFPIEVKFQNRINKGDYTTLKRNFNKGILLTKDKVFKDEGVVGLPVFLFLLLI